MFANQPKNLQFARKFTKLHHHKSESSKQQKHFNKHFIFPRIHEDIFINTVFIFKIFKLKKIYLIYFLLGIGQIYNNKSGKTCPHSKFRKDFHSFLIVVFSFSTTLGMIFIICTFYHLWYCHFDPINIFPLVIIITLPNEVNLFWKTLLHILF